MVDLLNILDHKRGTKILVNGSVYTIGTDGVARNVKEADALKLLQNNRVWKPHDPEKAAELRAKAKQAAKGKMQLIGPSGPIDKPGDPMDPNMGVYKRPNPTPPVKAEPEPPVPEKAETKEADEEPEDEVSGEPTPEAESEAAASDSEWPDPDESMGISYLREMADAYEVSFTVRTSKKTLVKRISEAMYE